MKAQTESLNLKSITVINPVTGWFEIMQYDDKNEIKIADLVEDMRLNRYPCPT